MAFSLRVLEKSDDKFEDYNGRIALFYGRLICRASGNLYKLFAYRIARRYVRNEMSGGVWAWR